MGSGWRDRDRDRDEVPLPAMSGGRGYMNVPATNNDRERDRNVGIGSGVGMGALHPSLASPNPPPPSSSSYASRRGSWDRGVSKGGVHGPYHSTPSVAERERERDRERGYGNLGGPTTPNQEPRRPPHRYGSPGPILPPAPNMARYSSSAVSNPGLGASADRAIDLTGTPPERESTWARHAAQRTKGTSNKPRMSASSSAGASASVNANVNMNANLPNANVVDDWGGGSYLTDGQRDRERERDRDRERYHSSVNGGGAGGAASGGVAAGGGYGLSVLPAEQR